MNRLFKPLLTLIMLICLALPCQAGDSHTPGVTLPPPSCTENCTNSNPAPDADSSEIAGSTVLAALHTGIQTILLLF